MRRRVKVERGAESEAQKAVKVKAERGGRNGNRKNSPDTQRGRWTNQCIPLKMQDVQVTRMRGSQKIIQKSTLKCFRGFKDKRY